MTQSKNSHDPVAVLRAEIEGRVLNIWDDANAEWGDAVGGPPAHEIFANRIISAMFDGFAAIATERAATQPAGEVPYETLKLHFFKSLNTETRRSVLCALAGFGDDAIRSELRTHGDEERLFKFIFAAPISEDTAGEAKCCKTYSKGDCPDECAPSPSASAGELPPLPKRLDYRSGETPEFSANQMHAHYRLGVRRGAEISAATYSPILQAARTPASVGSIGEDQQFSDLLAEYVDACEKAEKAKHFLLALPARDELCAHIDRWASSRATQPKAAARVADNIEQTRANFEDWYVTHIDGAQIGSADCATQWSAWLAGSSGCYKAPGGWKIAPLPWNAPTAPAAPDSARGYIALLAERDAKSTPGGGK